VLIRLFLVLVLAISLSTTSTWSLPDAGAATIVLVDDDIAPAEVDEAVLSTEPAWISEHPACGIAEHAPLHSPGSPHAESVFRPPRSVAF
jgi:hypothetical protein